jgi:hypothetical protein
VSGETASTAMIGAATRSDPRHAPRRGQHPLGCSCGMTARKPLRRTARRPS